MNVKEKNNILLIAHKFDNTFFLFLPPKKPDKSRSIVCIREGQRKFKEAGWSIYQPLALPQISRYYVLSYKLLFRKEKSI